MSIESKESIILARSAEAEWVAVAPGVSSRRLRLDKETGAATVLLKFEPGTSFPAHNHPGGEEVYVLEGEIKIGGQTLRAGDYLYTPPDGKHAASTKEGCVFLLAVPKPIEILGQ
jgi:quercetin dioxygenase-like cupin family protein